MKGLLTAFSIYSKIPVPRVKWDDKYMKYSLVFFPFVGAVIAGLLYGWELLCRELGCGGLLRICVATAVPLIVTGGFHVDGYMDTMDAFHSYKSREEKLEIMSDPHIGAFSVIMLALYYILFIGFYSEIGSINDVILVGGGFVISRALSAFMVVFLKPARGDGMLKYFNDTAGKAVVVVFVAVEMTALNVLLAVFISPVILIETAVAVLFALYYKYRCYKELGGVTGDTAGYFVTVTELLMCMTVAIYGLI
ncbi:MAG: adenosylcobinamide-GDP ribazoletransferase [Eubacterium sp.]|nr:adenosylcobinamide-GDP ribazoletransferase [Eubacterium sp.]